MTHWIIIDMSGTVPTVFTTWAPSPIAAVSIFTLHYERVFSAHDLWIAAIEDNRLFPVTSMVNLHDLGY